MNDEITAGVVLVCTAILGFFLLYHKKDNSQIEPIMDSKISLFGSEAQPNLSTSTLIDDYSDSDKSFHFTISIRSIAAIIFGLCLFIGSALLLVGFQK